MRASELAQLLASSAEDTARLLLPNGHRKGAEWICGDLDGAEGESLKLRLEGPKAGVWKDFATDESGDLVGLWMAVRRIPLFQACEEISDHLGIERPKLFQTTPRSYVKPSKDGLEIVGSPITTWLREVRKISDQAIAAYKLRQKKGALMFPYIRDGELIFAKYRAVPDKKFWTDAGCEPCLFGWQAIPPEARAITIVEGELDCLALYDYGWPALSVPFGGGNGDKQAWIEHEFDRLSVYDTIYLALDGDGPGQAATDEIIRRLGRERCRIVKLPAKDANKCTLDGISRGVVEQCFARAKTCDPPTLRHPDDYRAATVELMQTPPGQEAGIRLPWDNAGNRLILRPGEVSLWFGISGHGKTMVLGHVTATSMLNTRACVASLEFRPQNWLKRLVRQIYGEATTNESAINSVFDWLSGRLWLYDCHDTADRKELLETFKYAGRRYGIDLFVIDNLAKCGLAEDDYQGQKDFVDRLTAMARDENFHIALVHHSRKTERGESAPPDKFDAKGTGAITDMVDTVISVWRNKPKEKALEKDEFKDVAERDAVMARPDAILTCCKQRNGEGEPVLCLWFDHASQQYRSRQNLPVKSLMVSESEAQYYAA